MLHNNILGKLGKISEKILCAPKLLLAPTPMLKVSGSQPFLAGVHFAA